MRRKEFISFLLRADQSFAVQAPRIRPPTFVSLMPLVSIRYFYFVSNGESNRALNQPKQGLPFQIWEDSWMIEKAILGRKSWRSCS
jgi:hypothetical protein